MPRNTAWIRVVRTEALQTQKGRCLYCKSPLLCSEATADHKKPKRFGGLNAKTNIAAACDFCNQTKGGMWETDFWKMLRKKRPPKRADMMLIWASRRIWKCTHIACGRIEQRAR